jgi:hypothetical protein
MGAGLQAYKLPLDQRGPAGELVDIFATGEDVEPVTVKEQREFFEGWINRAG